jgi:hypothetical protein
VGTTPTGQPVMYGGKMKKAYKKAYGVKI